MESFNLKISGVWGLGFGVWGLGFGVWDGGYFGLDSFQQALDDCWSRETTRISTKL